MFAAIVNVISLRCVQQRTSPKNITPCITKNNNEPLFHADSCSLEKANKNNFLKK